MGKRGARDAGINMQARKEDIDLDGGRDQAESGGGGMQMASEAELAKRKIRRARRPGQKGANSFAMKSNPFATVDFGGGAAPSFQSAAAANLAPLFQSSAAAKPAATPLFQSKPAAAAPSAQSSAPKSKRIGLPSSSSSSSSKIEALNASFSSWVQAQAESSPDKSWVDGVQDYVKYVSELEEGGSAVAPTPAADAATPSAAPTPAAAAAPSSGGGTFEAEPVKLTKLVDKEWVSKGKGKFVIKSPGFVVVYDLATKKIIFNASVAKGAEPRLSKRSLVLMAQSFRQDPKTSELVPEDDKPALFRFVFATEGLASDAKDAL